MSTIPGTSADVFLRGTRDYVQGTQIMARAADLLPTGPWRFERAGFAQITHNIILIAPQNDDDTAIGSVHFKGPDEETSEMFVFDTGRAAPQKDQAMPARAQRQSPDPAEDASYTFSGVTAFEDMLNAIVIAIKNEHTVQFTGCTDVWLTGMRGLDIPVAGPFPETGAIKLQMMRALAGEHGQQTLWRLEIQGDDGANFARGAVTFSYKPGA